MKCPFCAEEIKDDAVKCKHCGEFLKEQKSFWRGSDTARAVSKGIKEKELSTRIAWVLVILLFIIYGVLDKAIGDTLIGSFVPFVIFFVGIIGIVYWYYKE